VETTFNIHYPLYCTNPFSGQLGNECQIDSFN